MVCKKIWGGSGNYQTFLIFCQPTQQAWKILPTLTDYVNIAPDPQKMLSYRQVSPRGIPTLQRPLTCLTVVQQCFISYSDHKSVCFILSRLNQSNGLRNYQQSFRRFVQAVAMPIRKLLVKYFVHWQHILNPS